MHIASDSSVIGRRIRLESAKTGTNSAVFTSTSHARLHHIVRGARRTVMAKQQPVPWEKGNVYSATEKNRIVHCHAHVRSDRCTSYRIVQAKITSRQISWSLRARHRINTTSSTASCYRYRVAFSEYWKRLLLWNTEYPVMSKVIVCQFRLLIDCVQSSHMSVSSAMQETMVCARSSTLWYWIFCPRTHAQQHDLGCSSGCLSHKSPMKANVHLH